MRLSAEKPDHFILGNGKAASPIGDLETTNLTNPIMAWRSEDVLQRRKNWFWVRNPDEGMFTTAVVVRFPERAPTHLSAAVRARKNLAVDGDANSVAGDSSSLIIDDRPMSRYMHTTGCRQQLILAFDFGLRRIGVAVGGGLTEVARPLPAIANNNRPDWSALARQVEQWAPCACVVGLPLHLDGSRQPITKRAERFADELRRRSGLPVYLCDETLTSRAADQEIRQARADGRRIKRVRKGDRDSMAACLILDQWLSDRPSVGFQRSKSKSTGPRKGPYDD